MKQEEFEWLKKWMEKVLDNVHYDGMSTHSGLIDAVEEYPPPIDEEKKEFVCPECGKPAMGLGGEGAYYQCMSCKKTWNFDWEKKITLNTSDITKVTCIMPGMKERKCGDCGFLEVVDGCSKMPNGKYVQPNDPACGKFKPIDEGIDTGCVFGPTKVCAGGEEPDCNRECEEPKPDLKVKIAGAGCRNHGTDFVLKGGHYYCPKCFPEGFVNIDKKDLNIIARCKSYRENQSDVCPCCGEVRKRAAP